MVWAPRDSDAILDIIFCSNPKYKNLYWEWGEIPNIIQMREGNLRKKLNSNYFEKLYNNIGLLKILFVYIILPF